ncbi:MAG: DUF4372 domain-containing protein, partial [Desulfuromonadaceae bacterium]
AKKSTYWSHLTAMLFGQWSARKSLRDVVFSINRQAHKLYHLGLSKVRRSTLSDANKLRPAVIFEKTYYQLYERLSSELTPSPQKAPQIKIWNTLIVYLLLVWVKCKPKAGRGLLELTRLAQTLLLKCMDLWAKLGLRPPDNRQPLLLN